MAKSKEQKRQEALERLNKAIADRRANGEEPTRAQTLEHNALSYPKRGITPLEKLFGRGDPVTGAIWAKPLPPDFKPTPELQKIVEKLQFLKDKLDARFFETLADMTSSEEYPFATYAGGGNYLDQWVQRHTEFQLYQADPFGQYCRVVFCRKGLLPSYDEYDNHIGGMLREVFYNDRSFYLEPAERALRLFEPAN